jgi:ribosomal protein L40E
MRKLCLVVLLLAGIVPSCAHVKFDNRTGKPISFTRHLGTDRKYEVVRNVDEDYRRKWLLLYLIPIGHDGTDMIEECVRDGEGMVNLRIKSEWDLIDVVVTNLTLGILCTRSVNVRGDLVRFLDQPAVPVGISCSQCGSAIPQGSRFCPRCGLSQKDHAKSRTCPKCQTGNLLTAKFCSACGFALEQRVKSKICASCGHDNPEGAAFCLKCGTRIGGDGSSGIGRCSKCGHVNPDGAVFCEGCGQKIK